MNRHQIRENIVFVLYQHLLLTKDIDKCFVNMFEEADDFILSIINDVKQNEVKYIEEISMHLKDWSFGRLSYIEQGILLEAWSEIKLGLNDKAIVVDEAVNICKTYCDEDSYKFINGVLDNL